MGAFSIIYAHVRGKGSACVARGRRRRGGRRAQTRDEFSYGGCEVGIGIAPRDSQTDRINANNWILPAISVSLERRAAQLRNAPRRRLRRRRWSGQGQQGAPKAKGRSFWEGGKKKRKRIPVVGEKFALPLRLPAAFHKPARIHQLADYVIYSAYFMREPAI